MVDFCDIVTEIFRDMNYFTTWIFLTHQSKPAIDLIGVSSFGPATSLAMDFTMDGLHICSEIGSQPGVFMFIEVFVSIGVIVPIRLIVSRLICGPMFLPAISAYFLFLVCTSVNYAKIGEWVDRFINDC